MAVRFYRAAQCANVPRHLTWRPFCTYGDGLSPGIDFNYAVSSSSGLRAFSSTASLRIMSPRRKVERMVHGEGDGKSQTYHRVQQMSRKIKSDELHPRKDGKAPQKVAKKSYKIPTPKTPRGPFSIFVACLPGLEPLLLEEVSYLLASSEKSDGGKAKAIPGGVTVTIPSLAHLYVLHLYLGTASHIYLRLNGGDRSAGLPPLFRARGFPELQRKLKELMVSQIWDRWFDIPHSRTNAAREESGLSWQLQVHVTTSKSKLMHTKAVEERVRQTIGEVLGIKGLDSTTSGVDAIANVANESLAARPVVRLLVRIDRDEVQLSLDTSSSSSATPLHMRGYRLNPHRAPLREDLAFALLMAGGLKPKWNLQPLRPWLIRDDAKVDGAFDSETNNGGAESLVRLFDPLCGSGTIAIEGASILAGLPPGRFRPPPFEGTKLYDIALWKDIKSRALYSSSLLANGKAESKTILVAANDINKDAIHAAMRNSRRAGVESIIDFTVGSFKIHPLSNSSRQQSTYEISDSRDLLIVTNPPYGKRMLADESNSIYKQIANALKSLPYRIRCTMIGKDPRSLRESSLPLRVAFSTKQGGLSVVAMSTGPMDQSQCVKLE
jgi:putative N6-adenine-specific DNA methylase